ncbi:16S rRNA (guanine(527)-N(7))-methyltransferase RsmG [Egicoccus sp. AB-alg2]|uniref:16S rRNA (guanine(527)-N(7))-methyltransferase RsmG n=1 Tax=Egicoccus sp. AB-alg2 TaxID=3242693 RepID=UPI00359DC027
MESLTPRQSDALEAFTRAVETSPHNLVSKLARSELRTRHIPESVAFARGLPAGAQRLLDIGSGGGFPGLVVAIVRPEYEIHLLDSTRKKADFLRDAAARLGLAVTVHNGRAEDLARGELAASFDLVTARAVASLERLIPWTLPFLRPGGVLHAIKGERWSEELAAAEPVVRRYGARVVATPNDADTAAADTDGGPSPLVVRIARPPI